jgi:HSP20 family protein
MADRANRQQEERLAGQRTQAELARRHHLDPFFYPFGGGLMSLSPMSMMRRMINDFDRIWEGLGPEGGERLPAWSPPIEVSEQNGTLIVCAELPGLSKSDIRVEATEDALIIEGERKREEHREEGAFRRSERMYGHFYRSIPLPEGVKSDEAKAKFNDGVLEIRMPVARRESHRRQIPLEGGGTSSSMTSSAERRSDEKR